MTKKRCIIYLFVIVVCVMNIVVSGFMFSKMLNTQPIVRLFGIGLSSCMRECDLRPACKSVNYRRMTHECLLNDKDDSDSTLTKTAGFVYHKKKVTSESCGPNTCLSGQTCSGVTSACQYKECRNSFSENVRGNMMEDGATRQANCSNLYGGTVRMLSQHCNADGLWEVEDDQAGKCLMTCQHDNLVSGRDPIPDSAITATSVWDNKASLMPNNSRIHQTKTTWSKGAWAPSSEDNPEDYIQAEFSVLKLVIAVVTKGRPRHSQYVKSYKLAYSQSCLGFNYFLAADGQNQTFIANTDIDTPVRTPLPFPVLAKCVRIQPIDYEVFKSLRFDVRGCHI